MTDEDIQKIRDSYLHRIAQVTDEAELEALRLSALGKKGEISLKMRELGGMEPTLRQTIAPALNALKTELDSALSAKKSALTDAALDARLKNRMAGCVLGRATDSHGRDSPR